MSEQPPSAFDLLRECQDRRLEREGIPMVLVLVNEVAPLPAVQQERVRADGDRLARSLDRYRDELLPTSRDDDMGCLTTALQVASYADFGQEGAQL